MLETMQLKHPCTVYAWYLHVLESTQIKFLQALLSGNNLVEPLVVFLRQAAWQT